MRLRKKSPSKVRKQILPEEVANARADQDAKPLKFAKELMQIEIYRSYKHYEKGLGP
jgi:hypothetical protein